MKVFHNFLHFTENIFYTWGHKSRHTRIFLRIRKVFESPNKSWLYRKHRSNFSVSFSEIYSKLDHTFSKIFLNLVLFFTFYQFLFPLPWFDLLCLLFSLVSCTTHSSFSFVFIFTEFCHVLLCLSPSTVLYKLFNLDVSFVVYYANSLASHLVFCLSGSFPHVLLLACFCLVFFSLFRKSLALFFDLDPDLSFTLSNAFKSIHWLPKIRIRQLLNLDPPSA